MTRRFYPSNTDLPLCSPCPLWLKSLVVRRPQEPSTAIILPKISFTIFAATVAVTPPTSCTGLNSTTSAPTICPFDRMQMRDRLPHRHSSRLAMRNSRRKRRIKHIHIERDIHRPGRLQFLISRQRIASPRLPLQTSPPAPADAGSWCESPPAPAASPAPLP